MEGCYKLDLLGSLEPQLDNTGATADLLAPKRLQSPGSALAEVGLSLGTELAKSCAEMGLPGEPVLKEKGAVSCMFSGSTTGAWRYFSSPFSLSEGQGVSILWLWVWSWHAYLMQILNLNGSWALSLL